MCAIPFGFAVVPLVYMRNSRSSASIGSGGHDAGSSEPSDVVAPVVAAVRHRHVVAGAPQDDAALDAGRLGHRLVGDLLQRDRRAAPPRLVLRDQHLAAHVVHPAGERVGGEAAEDDRVRRAEPRAGEHRDRQLGDHAHVDRDRRALPTPSSFSAFANATTSRCRSRVGDARAGRRRARLPSGTRPCRPARLSTCRSTQLYETFSLPPRYHFAYGELPLVERRERLEPRTPARGLRAPRTASKSSS